MLMERDPKQETQRGSVGESGSGSESVPDLGGPVPMPDPVAEAVPDSELVPQHS
jgi:hypothetical protein